MPAASTADLAQQLSELNMGLSGQQGPADAASGGSYPSQGGQQGLQDLNASLNSRQADMAGSRRSDIQGSYLPGMQQSMGPSSSELSYGVLLPSLGSHGSDNSRWGQKISSNDKFNEWKLFIGQVPLEANEDDLFTLFSPIGQILELYVLRNNNAKSRGCAFVTYASKQLAEQAITQLNGRQMPSGKTLVVKFADRASVNKAAIGGYLNLYMQ